MFMSHNRKTCEAFFNFVNDLDDFFSHNTPIEEIIGIIEKLY